MKQICCVIGYSVFALLVFLQTVVDCQYLNSHVLDVLDWQCTKDQAVGVLLPVQRECVEYTKDKEP